MKQQFEAQVLTIYVGESDHRHGGSLYAEIVAVLKENGIAGVTVLHGIEGYGAHRQLHTTRLEVLFQGLPIMVQAVDTPEHISTALALLDALLTESLVTVSDVHAIRYYKEPKE